MTEAARRVNLPLVGHAPTHLGLDALLESRQSLAHVGALSNLHFLPLAGEMPRLRLVAAAYALLTLAALAAAARSLRARLHGRATSKRHEHGSERASARGHRSGSGSGNGSGGTHETARDRMCSDRMPSGWVRSGWRRGARPLLATWLACTLALACAIVVLPGGPLSDRDLLRVAMTVLSLAAALAAIAQAIALGVAIAADAAARPRQPANRESHVARAGALLSALAGLTLAFQLVTFGLPLA